MSSNALTLPIKQLNEIILLPPGGADFTSRLQSGETLSGQPVVNIFVYSGTDPSPAGMLSGAASIVGNTVQQKFAGGVAGCIYKIIWACATSLGQFLEQFAYLVVQAETGEPSGALQYILLPGGQAIDLPGGQGILAPT
jgi:hypothetical protein